eukprot:CAMPEP_0184707904 /NCGR_PEP_ID=MMETSP0313-20130426/37506_1 /TAXON_ID=2792 /ORGANISM="Porphyridium aerugineum, Strain SAG 1380-2" /LENGTH=648 /DNA_ID=CAMNT_0027169485 /DNA_START=219 /DNA_END=2165 /DNA_ORIENTATION=+
MVLYRNREKRRNVPISTSTSTAPTSTPPPGPTTLQPSTSSSSAVTSSKTQHAQNAQHRRKPSAPGLDSSDSNIQTSTHSPILGLIHPPSLLEHKKDAEKMLRYLEEEERELSRQHEIRQKSKRRYGIPMLMGSCFPFAKKRRETYLSNSGSVYTIDEDSGDEEKQDLHPSLVQPPGITGDMQDHTMFERKLRVFEEQEAAVRQFLYKSIMFELSGAQFLALGTDLSQHVFALYEKFQPAHTAKAEALLFRSKQLELEQLFGEMIQPALRKNVYTPLQTRLNELRQVRHLISERERAIQAVLRRQRKVQALQSARSTKLENNTKKLSAAKLKYATIHENVMKSLDYVSGHLGNFIQPCLMGLLRLNTAFYSVAFRNYLAWDPDQEQALAKDVNAVLNRGKAREKGRNGFVNHQRTTSVNLGKKSPPNGQNDVLVVTTEPLSDVIIPASTQTLDTSNSMWFEVPSGPIANVEQNSKGAIASGPAGPPVSELNGIPNHLAGAAKPEISQTVASASVTDPELAQFLSWDENLNVNDHVVVSTKAETSRTHLDMSSIPASAVTSNSPSPKKDGLSQQITTGSELSEPNRPKQQGGKSAVTNNPQNNANSFTSPSKAANTNTNANANASPKIKAKVEVEKWDEFDDAIFPDNYG